MFSVPSSGPQPVDPLMFDNPGQQLFEAIAVHWGSSDSGYCPMPDAQARVAELERHYAIRLPEDFREYLIHAAPSQTYWDQFGTQWWVISDIKNLPDECPDGSSPRPNPEIERERETYLVFADFLLWCYAWAICCSEGPNRGRIAIIGGEPEGFVADSFREFVALALADHADIHNARTKVRQEQ